MILPPSATVGGALTSLPHLPLKNTTTALDRANRPVLHNMICNCGDYPNCGALDVFPPKNERLILFAPLLLRVAKHAVESGIRQDDRSDGEALDDILKLLRAAISQFEDR